MKKYLVAADILLFVLSLFFPVFLFASHDPVMGHIVLLWGWWGLIMLHFGWVANMLWIGGIVLFLRNNFKLARLLAMGAAVLALESFAVKEWWFNEGSGTEVTGFGAGFYLWMGAIVFLLILTYSFKKPLPFPTQ
ncbi:MAG TPA: hypothetical protein PLR06_02460 [Cyclobacteriaceae bacterium]|nr:hypothetical protein [Cyclobacteriaceae bacterium]